MTLTFCNKTYCHLCCTTSVPTSKDYSSQLSNRITRSLIMTCAFCTDVEHKAELLWPMSDCIEYTTTSKDSSLLAIGLKNNNLVIWDMLLGIFCS